MEALSVHCGLGSSGAWTVHWAGVGVGMLKGAGDSLTYKKRKCKTSTTHVNKSNINFKHLMISKFENLGIPKIPGAIISKLQISKFQKHKIQKVSNFQNFKNTTFQQVRYFSYTKSQIVQRCSHHFIVFYIFW